MAICTRCSGNPRMRGIVIDVVCLLNYLFIRCIFIEFILLLRLFIWTFPSSVIQSGHQAAVIIAFHQHHHPPLWTAARVYDCARRKSPPLAKINWLNTNFYEARQWKPLMICQAAEQYWSTRGKEWLRLRFAVNRKAEVGDNVACRPDGLCKNIFCDRIDVSF